MKPDQILIVTKTSWLLIKNDHCSEILPWSALQGSTVVYFDFANAQSGVLSFRGKATYATAMVEKEVRTTGIVEGELKVFIHQTKSHVDSVEAFYTAVMLNSWQELQSWATRQVDHCLLVPLTSLLIRRNRSSQSIIAGSSDTVMDSRQGASEPESTFYSEGKRSDSTNSRLGADGQKSKSNSKTSAVSAFLLEKQIFIYSEYDDSLHFAQVTMLGEGSGDIGVISRSLGDQLPVQSWINKNERIEWMVIRSTDLDSELATAHAVGNALHLKVQVIKPRQYHLDTKDSLSSSLYQLTRQFFVRNFSVPGLSKLAWLSESFVMPIAAVTAVACLVVGGIGVYVKTKVSDQALSNIQAKANAETLTQRANAVAGLGVSIVEDPELSFAAQLSNAALFDPARMLTLLRASAGEQIRIQRVQFVKSAGVSTYRVEGTVSAGANQELAQFLAGLRTQGWDAQVVQSTSANIGSFSYILRPRIQASKGA